MENDERGKNLVILLLAITFIMTGCDSSTDKMNKSNNQSHFGLNYADEKKEQLDNNSKSSHTDSSNQYNSKSDDSKENNNQFSDEGNSNQEEKTRELTESEKMAVSLSELIDEGLVYDTGNYIKGDITPGESNMHL